MEKVWRDSVCAMCSPYAMTFFSMTTFISQAAPQGKMQVAVNKACLCLPCDLLTAPSTGPHGRLCSSCVSLSVFCTVTCLFGWEGEGKEQLEQREVERS